ncbi:MAG: nucleoside kinase [Clostridium sp.]|uniref:nucleoside kinase n=1 Tax=Clostridium sp. TaxID=1506 RepID=UPI003029B132
MEKYFFDSKKDKYSTFKDLVIDKFPSLLNEIALINYNHKYYEIIDEIKGSGPIEFEGYNTQEGIKMYSRTLQYIFIKSALDILPNSKITVEHSISKGIFGEIQKEEPLKEEEIKQIKNRMIDIINKDIPIKRVTVTVDEAIKIFEGYGMDDKVSLLKHVSFKTVKLYDLDGRYDYFYGKMAPSTGIIKAFDLIYYEPGFILRYPEKENLNVLPDFKEQRKMFNIFIETKRWLRILGVGEVGSLNNKILDNELRELVLVCEALHEKKLANIADMIIDKKDVKLVLVAGPSSSGKTTFANRLGVQLRVNGSIPIPISLDDYFVDRDDTPKDEKGEYDFESIYALDLELFNEHLTRLLNGEEVEIPSFNFKKGQREWVANYKKLPPKGVLIIEGIHGLNPMLTSAIDDKNKFKIYISALTQLNLDNHNRISTTDIRKVRRIVRDSLSRGYGAELTLNMWPSIRRGEEKNIFVYQEQAYVMFNSTVVYELCVLKKYALAELNKIPEESPAYLEAYRLKSFLGFFKEIDKDIVPTNSILREFIGGSIFYQY